MQPTPTRAPDGMNASGDPERFAGIRGDYTTAAVERLGGSFRIPHTLAEMGRRGFGTCRAPSRSFRLWVR